MTYLLKKCGTLNIPVILFLVTYIVLRLYLHCASIFPCNQWSIFQTSLWCMEINVTCLYFSLCQDNAFLLIGFCFFQAFIFWYLNTDGQEFACPLKIIDFSTDCGGFSDESKLQEVTMGLPQRCCTIKSLTVTRWCNDVPQIWMGELERQFRVNARAGKQPSVISFPKP